MRRLGRLVLASAVLVTAAFRLDTVVSAQGVAEGGPAAVILETADPVPLPTFSVTAADGRTMGPEEFRGRMMLLNFWATWCGPCRVEMPSLDRLQVELGDEGFTVVAVSVDRAGKPIVDRFYDELALKHLGRYFDPRSEAANELRVRGLPTSILVDREGREVVRIQGALEWDQPAIKALIERYRVGVGAHAQ